MIACHGRILIPDIHVEDELGPLLVKRAHEVAFDAVTLERRDHGVVPDLVGTTGRHRLHVEFKVTHGYSSAKLARLDGANVSVLEVDLSGYRDVRLRDLPQAIVCDAPREMLKTPFHETGRRLLDQRLDRVADEFVAAMDRFRPIRSRETLFSGKLRKPLVSPYAEVSFGDTNLFHLANREWQAWIMLTLLRRAEKATSLAEFAGEFKRCGWVGEHEALLRPSVAVRVRRRSGKKVSTLEDIVGRFLGHLEALGLARRVPDGRWKAGPELSAFEFNRHVNRSGREKLVSSLMSQGRHDHRRENLKKWAARAAAVAGAPFAESHFEGWLLGVSRLHGMQPWVMVSESTILEETEMFAKAVESGHDLDRWSEFASAIFGLAELRPPGA
jgi:hypothetical protein